MRFFHFKGILKWTVHPKPYPIKHFNLFLIMSCFTPRMIFTKRISQVCAKCEWVDWYLILMTFRFLMVSFKSLDNSFENKWYMFKNLSFHFLFSFKFTYVAFDIRHSLQGVRVNHSICWWRSKLFILQMTMTNMYCSITPKMPLYN